MYNEHKVRLIGRDPEPASFTLFKQTKNALQSMFQINEVLLKIFVNKNPIPLIARHYHFLIKRSVQP